jgi:hypothetical protein
MAAKTHFTRTSTTKWASSHYRPGEPMGNIFYVDSNAADAADEDGAGRVPEYPFATLDYAVAACTADNHDYIFLMPAHNENLGDAQIDLDVAGISVIGLGSGDQRPRFDFDHANASIDIGADGIRVENIRLLPSVTAVLIGIDVEAGSTGTVLKDLEILPGEDGAGVDEFVLGIDLKAGASRTVIDGLKYRMHASTAHANAGISLSGASDDVEIKNCDLVVLGGAAVAPIKGITTLSTNVRIHHNLLVSDAEPGIELLTGTTGVAHNNYIASDLGSLAASIVGDALYLFENYNCEVVTETGGLVGTASVDD